MLTRGLTGSGLVVLGGLGVATLPPSAPALHVGVLAAARGSEAGRMASLTIVLIGLGLLASAWLALCRHVAISAEQDRADAVDLVRFATLVWSAPLVIAPPLFSRDGWSYAAQGMLAHRGLSPYEHGPDALLPQGRWAFFPWDRQPIVQAVDPMWMDTATPYGPLPLWFGKAVASATGNPWILVIGHRVLALVGLALLAWAVPRIASWTRVNPALASALVLISPMMVANGVAGLHNDLLMAGLMAAALVVAAERGWFWGAALGGLAAAVKVPGGLVCVGIVLLTLPAAAGLRERAGRIGAVALVALTVLFGLGAASGLGNGWIEALAVPGVLNTPLSITSLTGGLLDGLAHLAGLATPPDLFRGLVRLLGLAVSIGLGAWVATTWRTGDRTGAVRAVAVVVGAFVVLCPVVHLWYFLAALPFVATLPLPRPAMSALLAASVVMGMVAPLDSSLHGAYLAIVLACMTLAVLLPVLLLTRRARDRIDRIASAKWLVLN